MEGWFQGADLAETWDSSFSYFLRHCCLDFSCDGWNSCSCIGQLCNLGDGYHPSFGWPTSRFVSVGEKNQVYLAKVIVVLVFHNVHRNLIMILLLLLSHFSHVRLCATPQTATHWALPSLGFSRQAHCSRLPFPSPMHESEK